MTKDHARSALLASAASLVFFSTSSVFAHDDDHDGSAGASAAGHAPIGVMGDHTHKAGEFMLSYRYMRMDMGGNRIGTNSVSPEEIVTTVPNRFFGMPGQPPNLRIVPLTMEMDMHMVGAMYAPTDWVTLMVMGMYEVRTMDHVTFQGGMGTNVLGNFTTQTQDFGDTSVAALWSLYDDGTHFLHINTGVSIPTGTQSETDDILTPMGGTPTVRLPYPMQIGSGTWDLLPGITYRGSAGQISWGAQYSARLRLGTNDDNYSLGDLHQVTAWGAVSLDDWVSLSARVQGSTLGRIDGQDPLIMGPVQTANPDFQGGERIDILGGVNFLVTDGALKGNRFAIEFGAPFYQDLNGPQMETNWTLTAGWQLAF